MTVYLSACLSVLDETRASIGKTRRLNEKKREKKALHNEDAGHETLQYERLSLKVVSAIAE